MMQELDTRLLTLFNRDLANPMFDIFFPFWTDFQKSPLFYILIATILMVLTFKRNWRAIVTLFICAVGMFISDSINSKLLKPFFDRARPSNVILRTAEHGGFSFPSSHAVTIFFMAIFLGISFPKLRIPLFVLACLTAFSRVYCGVHYPGDIMAGMIVGSFLGFLFHKSIYIITKKKFLFLSLFLALSSSSYAYEDPTNGKPFFPWAWNDQIKPVIVKGFDETGWIITASAAASVFAVHQYDGKIFDFSEEGGNLLMGHNEAEKLGKLGNGMAGIILVGSQFYFDQGNGLKSFRALIMTSVSHVTMAAIVQRDRPRNRSDFLPFPSSFPSGHTSSAFALAGSMAYSYGWAGGIPAYILASGIGLSRIKENRHWASDVVGGAFLGTFWARASFNTEPVDKEAFIIFPTPIRDGFMLSAVKVF